MKLFKASIENQTAKKQRAKKKGRRHRATADQANRSKTEGLETLAEVQ